MPTITELASEFRGRDAVIEEGDLVIAVSQSGETIDTLMAAKEAKARGAKVLAIANVNGSAPSSNGAGPSTGEHCTPLTPRQRTTCLVKAPLKQPLKPR